ncbi:MAG: FtsH protease activity modulator HflK [Gammaproteobacteria bacterium]|nr:MAG: FtsH protease activity modulator HflK [Gammaproteobacteria bacterium]
MAWNESGNNRNPWDRGGGDRQGPPDLDRILRDWQRKLAGFFRGGRSPAGPGPTGSTAGFGWLALLVLVGWIATGLYRVDEAEQGVVLRFGKFAEVTMPGLRWHIPWPVESVELVNVSEISPFNKQTRMLTADENIVDVDLVVQYQKADPVKYLFRVRDPEGTISDVSESAIRDVIGKSKMDFALGEGRTQIAQDTKELIQKILDEYGAGIRITTVNLQDINFPEQVDAAVQDAIKAREDRERLAFEAQAYANDVLPRARGEAARRIADAEAYKARVTANAQGEAARFESLLKEYERAPAVTRERLYIESVENVLSRSNKVILDAKANGNLVYLPIDKILESRGLMPPAPAGSGSTSSPTATEQPEAAAGGEVDSAPARESLRSRGVR